MLGRPRNWDGVPRMDLPPELIRSRRQRRTNVLWKEFTNIKKMKLISTTSYAISKEEDIALLPGYFLGRILETCAGTAHDFAFVVVVS